MEWNTWLCMPQLHRLLIYWNILKPYNPFLRLFYTMLSIYRVGSCGVGRVIDMWSELRSTTRALALPFVLPLILTWRSQLQSSLSNFRVPLYYTSLGGSAATRWKFSLKGVTTQISPAGSSSNPLPHFSEQPAALPRAQSEYHAFKKSVLPTEDGRSMTTFYYYILCKSLIWFTEKHIFKIIR